MHAHLTLTRFGIFCFALVSLAFGQITFGPGDGASITPGGGGGGPTVIGPGGGFDGGGVNPGGGIINPGDGGTITIPGDGSTIGGPNVTEPTLITPRGALLGATVTATVLLPRTDDSGSTPPTYQWSVSGATASSPTRSATFEFVADKVGTVMLHVSGTYGGTPYDLSGNVTVISATTAGKITVPATLATSATSANASVPPAQNADRTFRWAISGDGTITDGQTSANATFRPGTPGAKELTCTVNLQNLVSVTLRSIVVVTGDGPTVTVTVNNGSGGGSYSGGSRVDLFANAPTATQVFDHWTGDTSAFGASESSAITSPHLLLTVPPRAVALTATYRTVSAWTPTTIADFGGSGIALSYFMPTRARGLIFLIHDAGADAASWFNRPEPLQLARDLVAAGYGVAALSSAKRGADAAWSTATTLEANADLRNHIAALEKFARENAFTTDRPVFFFGTGASGPAAAQLAQRLTEVRPAWAPKGVVLFNTFTTEAVAVTAHLPHLFVLANADDLFSRARLTEVRNSIQLLTGRGVTADLATYDRSPVYADRLRTLGVTSPGFTATDAQTIWSALKNADLLDSNSHVRNTPDLDDVEGALPSTWRGRAADVLALLTIARAGQELSSECDARVLAFLDAGATAASEPVPGRLVNVSTRTKIAFVGDALTLGFTLAGEDRATLLLRGIGPGLADFGIDPALTAPRLEVFRGSTLLAVNEGWGQASNAAEINAAAASVGAFPLKPGALDAAALLALDAGSYTATLRGLNGASGDALVEIYDVSRNRTRLTNLSVLGSIHNEGDLLVPGIVVAGTNPRTFIARAVGPGLSDLGLDASTVLGDPRLAILNSSGSTVRSNQNWSLGSGLALAAAFPMVGAFPLKANSADAALVAALMPGNYTLQVGATVPAPGQAASTASLTGTVLVEVYEVP